MIRILRDCPLVAHGSCGKRFDFVLEPTTVIRPLAQTTRGDINVEVWAGKYEGVRGTIPKAYCTVAHMSLR